jgi:hypothetical protein
MNQLVDDDLPPDRIFTAGGSRSHTVDHYYFHLCCSYSSALVIYLYLFKSHGYVIFR